MPARPQSSRWTLTENKDPYRVLERLKTLTEEKTLTYVVAQVEQGTHLHLQAYLHTSRSRRLAWLKTHVSQTGHFEAAEGSAEENKTYCSKVESRVDGPWEYGTLPRLGRPKADKGQAALRLFADLKAGISTPKLIEDHFPIYGNHIKTIDRYIELTAPQRNLSSPPEVIVHFGIPGSGKSRAVRFTYPDAYYKPVQSKWWTGYDGQETVVFDDFNGSWFSWSTLMQVLDLYPCKVETKGGHTELLASRFVFTTNVNPCDWYHNAKCPQEALIRRITQIFYYTSKEESPACYASDDKDSFLRDFLSHKKSSEAAMSREDDIYP